MHFLKVVFLRKRNTYVENMSDEEGNKNPDNIYIYITMKVSNIKSQYHRNEYM